MAIRHRGPRLRGTRPDRRHIQAPSRKQLSPHRGSSSSSIQATSPAALSSLPQRSRCGVVTCGFANAAVIPRPISAGRLGMARTIAAFGAKWRRDAGHRASGCDGEHGRLRPRMRRNLIQHLRHDLRLYSQNENVSAPRKADLRSRFPSATPPYPATAAAPSPLTRQQESLPRAIREAARRPCGPRR